MGEVGPAEPSRRWVVVAIAGSGLALATTAVVAAAAQGLGWPAFVDTYTLTNVVIGLGFLGSGGVIGWYRPRSTVGRLFLACGLGHLLTAAAGMLVVPAIDSDAPDMAIRLLVTVYEGAWQFGLPGLFPLALLLFPDGRLPSPRWRWLAWVLVLGGAFQPVTGLLSDDPEPIGGDPRAQSVLSIGLVLPDAVYEAVTLVGAAATAAVVASLVVRYRRGTDLVRSQLQWLILAVLAMIVLNTQRWLTGDGPILLLLSFVLVPIAIAIAIVRHRLLDIRFVLSRTLLYVLAVSAVVAAYAGGVAAVSLLVPAAERGLSIVVAIVVAIGFNPVRQLLQRAVDRAFYGGRADPAGTAASVGDRLRHDDGFDGVLDRARTALRLPYLAVLREPGGVELAAVGTEQEPMDLPLRYRGEVVGTLRVGLRRGDRTLHDADRRALDLIGLPLAVALHATALAEQVQLARVAVVDAGERERVRLQRDLHDGLGPSLTSIRFRADAASNVLRDDPDRAEALLTDIRGGLREALDDVRRVVYGLRPIDLDALGLIEVLRRHVAGLPEGGPSVTVDGVECLPPLSAAVELAGYRIVCEAITNVLRHSDASRCTVLITSAQSLTITVCDNGTRSGPWRAGVGLRSIVDRAEEVGGTATVGPTLAGWEVSAELPLVAAAIRT